MSIDPLLPLKTDKAQYTIHIGGVKASREPALIQTVLGSCIAVCLRDPVGCIGGMNHFLLPEGQGGDQDSTRYGVNAMELLINECMKAGAERNRLVAKVFGGGHVLSSGATKDSVPARNIQFIRRFLQTEAIPVVGEDVGGRQARKILFFTDTGRTLLKRLDGGTQQAYRVLEQMQKRERAAAVLCPPESPLSKDNVTLF